ncbi:hypothetical protein CAEBREN_23106 [Caenorhabditis brenneri]|uniref:RING-type domain-containing protein n=1 Tax=Caenorhabditis brenneri TaxID=135651 RepID=G0MWY2_CAEBE|nr:hypothetical protein CAEBREN_23106 [Caenorhabditis brenneri]
MDTDSLFVSESLVFIWIVYAFSVGSFFLIFTIGVFFSPPFDPVLFDKLIAFCVVTCGIFGVFKLLEYGLNRFYQANQVRIVKQDKINFLVGFGGIIICTIIPRVAVYFVDMETFFYICLLAILCILLLPIVFLGYSRQTVKTLNYNAHFKSGLWLFGIQTLIFIVSMKMLSDEELQEGRVAGTQLLFGITTMFSSLDFIVVWNDGFHLYPPRDPVEAPAVRTETSKDSFTDFSVIAHCLLSVLTLIFGFWILGGATILKAVLGCAVIFGLVDGLAVVLGGVSERGKMLIGLGAMGIIGCLPRICHGILVEANMSNLLISMILTLSLTLSIYYHFIYTNRPPFFHFQYEAHESIIIKFAVIHFLILLAIIRTSYGYWENEELEVIILSQFAFFLLPLASSIDFWMIWNGAVVLKDDEFEVVTVRKTRRKVVKKIVKLTPPKVTCSSCHQSYNEDNKTPRILKECGHTICEECANNLLARNHWKHLFCPTCRRVTVVQGAASTLKKNYLVLEMMEEAGSM